MAHGDTQRLGGELGYGSDKLPLVAEDDVTVEAPEADEITYDPGANTIVDGITVAAALDTVEAEFVTPTHVHAGGGEDFTHIGLAANFAYTKDAATHASGLVLPVSASTEYLVRITLPFVKVDAGGGARFDLTVPAGAAFDGYVYGVGPSGGKALTVFTGAAVATFTGGDSTTAADMFYIEGMLVVAGTAGNLTVLVGDSAGTGTGYLSKTALLSIRAAGA